MSNQTFTFLFLSLLTIAYQNCITNPSCFKKHLFDFSYPSQNIYRIGLTSDNMLNNYMVRSYGDFNNDLHSDYAALSQDGSIGIYLFDVNSDLFVLSDFVAPKYSCLPKNLYLYDLNDDNLEDITVWGEKNGSNCLYPLIQNSKHKFTTLLLNPLYFMQTTQPILLETNIVNSKVLSLLIYSNNTLGNISRTIYYYDSSSRVYSSRKWSQMFINIGTNYEDTGFSNIHWNSVVDLTGDCYPDVTITNSRDEIQFWVYKQTKNHYYLSTTKSSTNSKGQSLVSLSYDDFNYDGTVDLALSYPTAIYIYNNLQSLNLDSQFCQYYKDTLEIEEDPSYTILFPVNYQMQQQYAQVADLDIDGYPEIIVIIQSIENDQQLVYVLHNLLGSQNGFEPYFQYNLKINQFIAQNDRIHALSVFDILENGIYDFIIPVYSQSLQQNYTLALFNNYLNQNYFFLKAYAVANSASATEQKQGTTLPGVTFYWVNSLGNSQRVAIGIQYYQSAYSSMNTPYMLRGLGKANNYVERLTVGRLGKNKDWSPIIPNSQLAIFTTTTNSDKWTAKIFVTPTQSLIYVVIVSGIILLIMGGVLLGLKCKKKHNEEKNILMEGFH